MATRRIGLTALPGWRVPSAIGAGLAGLFLLALLGSVATAADSSKSAPAGYQQSRFLIPMRDGVRLDTLVLAPADTTRSYPILLVRTPYEPSPTGSGLEPAFVDAGYIF